MPRRKEKRKSGTGVAECSDVKKARVQKERQKAVLDNDSENDSSFAESPDTEDELDIQHQDFVSELEYHDEEVSFSVKSKTQTICDARVLQKRMSRQSSASSVSSEPDVSEQDAHLFDFLDDLNGSKGSGKGKGKGKRTTEQAPALVQYEGAPIISPTVDSQLFKDFIEIDKKVGWEELERDDGNKPVLPPFTSYTGLNYLEENVAAEYSPLQWFHELLHPELYQVLVQETNKYAESATAKDKQSKYILHLLIHLSK